MATLQERNGSYRVLFLHRGKRHTFTLGRVSREEAEAKTAQVEYLLMRLKQGLLAVPDGIDVATFVLLDGKPPAGGAAGNAGPEEGVSLGLLRDRYLRTHGNGTLEDTTLETARLHFKHLVASLGEQFPARSLSLSDLQRHVDRRAQSRGKAGRRLNPLTVKREVETLRAAWNWAERSGLVTGRFPNVGLRYPKGDEKPPFQTWEEIERQVARGGLSDQEQKDLWDCLFLNVREVEEFLRYVREATTARPFVYPMICFAAHTGTRRSELLRVRIADVDLDGGTALVREKKRARGKRTSRRVPLSSFLQGVLRAWLATHPGGPFLFSHFGKEARGPKATGVPTAISPDEAYHCFEHATAGSKWAVLRGWHVLRHSFISNCAACGVDQRMIDEWVGHTTEEMRKRYRHLFPDQQQAAIRAVFG
jgi:integrase